MKKKVMSGVAVLFVLLLSIVFIIRTAEGSLPIFGPVCNIKAEILSVVYKEPTTCGIYCKLPKRYELRLNIQERSTVKRRWDKTCEDLMPVNSERVFYISMKNVDQKDSFKPNQIITGKVDFSGGPCTCKNRGFFKNYQIISDQTTEPSNCGDGICQEVVWMSTSTFLSCMAIGCPTAETPQNCPQDCTTSSAPPAPSVPLPPDCTDTDGGKNYYVKGSGEGYYDDLSGKRKGSDFCNRKDPNILHEQFCDDKVLRIEKYKCPKGCENGACLQTGCAKDLKRCPDGTTLSRAPPDCTFPLCPAPQEPPDLQSTPNRPQTEPQQPAAPQTPPRTLTPTRGTVQVRNLRQPPSGAIIPPMQTTCDGCWSGGYCYPVGARQNDPETHQASQYCAPDKAFKAFKQEGADCASRYECGAGMLCRAGKCVVQAGQRPEGFWKLLLMPLRDLWV